VREHHSEVAIESELRVAARAIGFKGFFMFARHGEILRQFAPRGMVTVKNRGETEEKKTALRKIRSAVEKAKQKPKFRPEPVSHPSRGPEVAAVRAAM